MGFRQIQLEDACEQQELEQLWNELYVIVRMLYRDAGKGFTLAKTDDSTDQTRASCKQAVEAMLRFALLFLLFAFHEAHTIPLPVWHALCYR